MPKGVAVARAERLREARERGVVAPLEIATYFEAPPLVFPKMTEQSARFESDELRIGSSLIREARLVRKADWLQLNATIVLERDDREAAREFVRAEIRGLIGAAADISRRAGEDRDIQTLPIGAIYVDVFLHDLRRRGLSGLGHNMLCRIVERARGEIQDWPLYKSDVELCGRTRFEWNTLPYGDDGLDYSRP
ncbi:MAG TPA: hypothetical protein VGJ82_06270, partial [Thermoanaerobaculia bacterium]|jgi:hypothetical protein